MRPTLTIRHKHGDDSSLGLSTAEQAHFRGLHRGQHRGLRATASALPWVIKISMVYGILKQGEAYLLPT